MKWRSAKYNEIKRNKLYSLSYWRLEEQLTV
jgi:tRNA(His) 5'-end guanylyltransferase